MGICTCTAAPPLTLTNVLRQFEHAVFVNVKSPLM
jgi:hypothetical protein